jgi:hypothetical protein
MEPLIPKQPKDTKKSTTVSLSGSIAAELELYMEFIDSGRDWIINQALKVIFTKDRAFIEWKERRPAFPSNGQPAELPTPAATVQKQSVRSVAVEA